MLNISFLACTKVELWYLIVCIAVNGEKYQSCAIGLAMPNIELVRSNFSMVAVRKTATITRPREIGYYSVEKKERKGFRRGDHGVFVSTCSLSSCEKSETQKKAT